METNLKKQHGPALIAARYMLVPIKAGEKTPNKKGWPKIRATMKDLNAWIDSRYYGGLGVLGEFNPGIDIDVRDREIVDKLRAWCTENIGEAPYRIGDAPRILIPCSAPPGGLGPDKSAKYEDELGVTHQIEIKATGQQWVAYGQHPKTKTFYTWVGGELHETESDLLPTLTGEKIDALFEYFDSIAPRTKLSKGRPRARSGGVASDGELQGFTAFENYKPPLNIDADRVRSILSALSPDGQVNGLGWRSVGMAIYHQFEGSQEGLDIFLEWSESSADYNYEEIMKRWPSWGANTYAAEPITFASVIQMYNTVTEDTEDPTLQKKSKKLSDWEKRFSMVDLPESTEVYDGGVPIHKVRRHTLRAFKEQNSGYNHRFVNADGAEEVEPMVTAWQNSRNVRHYAGYTYLPGGARYCRRQNSYDDDTMYINNFFFPPHVDEIPDYQARVEPFKIFLTHLFPNEPERAWFIEWLARLIQNPSVRSFVTPINITPVTGTGRGILFDILRLLVGAHNTHDVSADDIEGRFNGFLDKCLIAVVQEIKANTGSRKYQTWERMKSLLADTVANIQAKGQDSYTSHVYANFLMFSNNIDALPLRDVNERRIYAMRGAGEPLDNAGIDKIIKWKMDDLNISALFKYLKLYPVDEGHFKRAPKTLTKIQMVNASVGVGGADVDAWLQEEAPAVFDYDYAAAALEGFSEDIASVGMGRDRFRRMLQDKGYHSVQIRLENQARKYVYFHPDKTKNDPALLKKLYNKTPEELL
jgi:hypothetical protein